MKKDASIQAMWYHAVLSFVILLLNSNGKKTVISRDSDGVFYANIPGGTLPFDGAYTLYSAFCWFHSHLEEYGSLLTEAYNMYGKRLFPVGAHCYPSNLTRYQTEAILEFPQACRQKEYWLTPFEFTNLLFKAFKAFAPDLYFLDLHTDVLYKKELLKK